MCVTRNQSCQTSPTIMAREVRDVVDNFLNNPRFHELIMTTATTPPTPRGEEPPPAPSSVVTELSRSFRSGSSDRRYGTMGTAASASASASPSLSTVGRQAQFAHAALVPGTGRCTTSATSTSNSSARMTSFSPRFQVD